MPSTQRPIAYTTKRSTRAKNLRLTVKEDGEVVLTLPRYCPQFMGKIFVQKNIDWIKKKRALVQKNKVNITSAYLDDFQPGQLLTFFDQKKYSIKVATDQKRNTYQLEENTLCLQVVKNTKAIRQQLVSQFYQDTARDYLTDRSVFYAKSLGVSFNQIRLKNTKSRWGSCSSKKNLNFNWRIMLAPPAVIDYLVAHEVCHLREMNHSSKFWDLVASLDPNFKQHKKWLKDNERRLLGFLS